MFIIRLQETSISSHSVVLEDLDRVHFATSCESDVTGNQTWRAWDRPHNLQFTPRPLIGSEFVANWRTEGRILLPFTMHLNNVNQSRFLNLYRKESFRFQTWFPLISNIILWLPSEHHERDHGSTITYHFPFTIHLIDAISSMQLKQFRYII